MKRVLLVEDDPVSTKLFESFLKEKYDFKSTNSIEGGMQLVNELLPHVLLLDFVLPDGNALKLLKYIKDNKLSVRSVVITKFSNTEIIKQCQAEGAFDFFQKPISKDMLIEYVEIASTYTKGHAFLSSEHEKRESIKYMNMPVLFDNLLHALAGDQAVMKEVLQSCIPELESLKENIAAAYKMPASAEQRDSFIFYLHRVVSVAGSIYAEKLRKISDDLQTSLLRNETLQPADLHLLNEEILDVCKAIEKYIQDRS